MHKITFGPDRKTARRDKCQPPDVIESLSKGFFNDKKTRLWRPEFARFEYTHAKSSAIRRRMRNEMFLKLRVGTRLRTHEGTELVTAKIPHVDTMNPQNCSKHAQIFARQNANLIFQARYGGLVTVRRPSLRFT